MQIQLDHRTNYGTEFWGNGSSLKGNVTTTFSKLVRTFGAPTMWDGDKTNAEWEVVFQDGVIATIYDYYQYNTPLEQITDWHIGGTTQLAAEHVKAALGIK